MTTRRPFREVPADGAIPGQTELEEMATDAHRARKERFAIPTFSEMFLYPRVGKGDARFILAIAKEYQALLDILGDDLVAKLLANAEALRREQRAQARLGETGMGPLLRAILEGKDDDIVGPQGLRGEDR